MKIKYSSYCYTSVFKVRLSIDDNKIGLPLQLGLPLKQVGLFIRCSRLKTYLKHNYLDILKDFLTCSWTVLLARAFV